MGGVFKLLRVDLFVVLLVVLSLSRRGVHSSDFGDISSEHFTDISGRKSGEAFKQEKHVGEKSRENQNGVADNKKTDFVDANDAAQYSDQDSNKKSESENGSYGAVNYSQNQAADGHNVQQQTEQKKGHHKNGFHNSYHKDESSNKSTYFDDFADSGGQSVYNNHRNSAGNQNGQEFQGSKRGGTRHEQDNFRGGHYNKGGGHDSRYADHNDYGKRRYFDDSRDFNRANRGQSFVDRNKEYAHEDVVPAYRHIPAHYYPGAYGYPSDYDDVRPLSDEGHGGSDPAWSQQHHTITIYEDPRIPEGFADEPLLDDSRDIRLDVGPGQHRYQRYDSYYEPQADGGLSRRSNINRLVYNYNNRY